MRRKCNEIPKLHIKKGDLVKVLSGNEYIKGKKGKVLQVNPLKRTAIVEGINMITKHVKKASQVEGKDSKFQREAPLAVCKLQLIEPRTGKPTRIGRTKTDNGWVRVSKKTGNKID